MNKINSHKKGSIPAQDQAFHINKSNTTPAHNIKAVSKKEWAFLLLLQTPSGITENDVLFNCQLSSGRNYPNELERELSIGLGRKNIPNSNGIDSHQKYWITCREDALKVVHHINKMCNSHHADPLSICEIEVLISVYPDKPEHTA